MPEWYTTGQVGAMLGVDDATVRRWCDRRGLPYVEFPSKRRMIPREPLFAWIRANVYVSKGALT